LQVIRHNVDDVDNCDKSGASSINRLCCNRRAFTRRQALAKRAIANLNKALGGLVVRDVLFKPLSGEPNIPTRLLGMGNVHALWTHIPLTKSGTARSPLQGAGTGLTPDLCLVPALGEVIERYCACVHTREQFVWSTAADLGRDALDLDSIPRCSKTELSHPKCRLVEPSKTVPIRWVRGVSLLDGRPVFLPVVMVYLYAGYTSDEERIVVPITTGCAAHENYERAILSGILEIIERDAISLLWLQRLRVPRLRVDGLASPWDRIWSAYEASSQDLRYIFLNATTDLGIFTVFGIRVAPSNPKATTLTSCASSFDPPQAVSKVIRDLNACGIGFRGNRSVPDHWDDFNEVHHGATYMADAAQASAFNFLLESEHTQDLASIRSPVVDDGNQKNMLESLLLHLKSRHLESYVVDLSTDEALRAGVRVVRVIIPALQPLPYRYRARYLAHPRLYNAPLRMGYSVNDEQHVNPWPTPFS
jgi:ribosomal protein S12 methylthiotransferase accessory factor